MKNLVYIGGCMFFLNTAQALTFINNSDHKMAVIVTIDRNKHEWNTVESKNTMELNEPQIESIGWEYAIKSKFKAPPIGDVSCPVEGMGLKYSSSGTVILQPGKDGSVPYCEIRF